MRPILACALTVFLLQSASAQDAPVALQGGVPTDIPGTNLTIVLSDLNDVRCPAGALCAWEGEISVELTVTTGSDATTIMLCNFCDHATYEATIAGHTIRLAGLAPSTADLEALARPVTLADYTVMLHISP